MTRLTFTPGNHAYWLADPDTGKKTRLTSVTGLLGLLGKPALVKWAARAAADHAIDHWDDLAALPMSERRDQIAAAPDMARNRKAASGTAIHAMAEDLLAGRPVEVADEERPRVEGLARFIETSGITVVTAEQLVWSGEDDDLGLCAFAGQFDALVKHPRHGALLLDWKTGSGVYADMAVQLAGYAAADMWVVDGEDVPATPVDAWAVAHVTPGATDLHLVAADQRRPARDRFDLLRALQTLPVPQFTMENN